MKTIVLAGSKGIGKGISDKLTEISDEIITTSSSELDTSNIEQVKKFQEKLRKAETSAEKVEHNGFFVSKKLINKESNKACPVCSKYTLNVKDDVCIVKFECCFDCFVKYVDNREERWLSGWRPKTLDKGDK